MKNLYEILVYEDRNGRPKARIRWGKDGEEYVSGYVSQSLKPILIHCAAVIGIQEIEDDTKDLPKGPIC